MITEFRLINFLEDPEFNSLRFAMNASLAPPIGSGKLSILDEEFIRKLGKEGIDVDDFSEIKVESDNTLSYKNKRVLVYIRDIKEYSEQQSLPKFHLGFCSTLETMTNAKRFGRYVVYNGEDTNFTVNYIGPPTRTAIEKLNVCKNCLSLLRWKDYSSRASSKTKSEIVSTFDLAEFFEKYPKDLMSIIPRHSVDTAPLNDYTDDWGLVSEKIKQKRGYKCESCGLDLNGPGYKHFLHAHHKDGEKSNNKPNNIELLCLGCHAEEPMHSHMKSTQQYKLFSEKFNR